MNTHIQLLRNAQLYTSRQLAVDGMTNKAKELADGTPILGRYRVEDNGPVYSLLGIVHNTNPSASAGTITILSDTSDINSLKATISALDYADTEVDNNYVSKVAQTDGKIAVTRKELPVHNVSDSAVENQFVTALNLDHGVIKADRSGITTAQVSRTATTALSSTTAEAALSELSDKITAASHSAAVTVETLATATQGMLKTYSIKQGGNEVGKIDIPKDFLVKSGSVVKGTFAKDTNVFTEDQANGKDTAIKLVINAKEADGTDGSPVYINVHDLVDIYKGTTGDTVNVTVNGYNISASLSESAQTRVNNALTGVTVNSQNATVNNNVASVTVNASQVKFSTDYTKNEYGVVSADTSIEENVKALEKAVLDNETAIAASENHLNDIKLEGIKITGGTVNGGAEMASATTASIVINGGTVKVASLPTATGTIAVGDTIDTALAKLGSSSSADSSKVSNIIAAVGLGDSGTYSKTTGATTSAATSTKTAIEALDTAVVANDKKHTLSSPNQTISIVPVATGTTIDVQFDNTSIKQTSDKKFYVDTIDGGTY